ncbi:serine/threonine kinase [Fragilaria crotonensis]|nr:serine/threonine kinase [Fragilaria crotonensis]
MTLDEELIENARDGNLDKVRDLLRRGANVNAKTEYGYTALIWASYYGHLEVVCALLNHDGVDVNIQNCIGETALICASYRGHLEVVCPLLMHNGVDVNIQNNNGNTALIYASDKGHSEVVRALLKDDDVDVNIKSNRVDVNFKNDDGKTALIRASKFGHLELVRSLLNHNGVDVNIKNENGETALDVAREWNRDDVARLLEEHMDREKLRKEKERNPHKKPEAETTASEEKRPSSTAVAMEKDHELLLHVMNTPSADPAELSLEYIERCIMKDSDGKPIILGSGGYGDVFLAEDSRLPKKFAVKKINPTKHDKDTIEDIRKSFQTELSTLKRFRHPNIIVLYGYSLNANRAQQCLVYEYAANGSLAGFFTDDGNRARLSADTRLSIMFELTRAVHFLHTGGCKVKGKGWKVFHRDIKSANICLADDFTPRLIDCGLAKFVRDDNYIGIPGAVTLKSTNGDGTFGTAGYMCPEYVRKKAEGTPCPYIAAYDVFSLGVVLVELILGCLNGRQSTRTRNGMQFVNAFRQYVKDERDLLIVDGCEKLKRDADPTIIWRARSLELVCKAAIQCMAPFSDQRLSTDDLLNELREAIGLKRDTSVRPPGAVRSVESGPLCLTCNDYCADLKCSEGHALCTSCVEENLLQHLSDRGQLLCLINGCSSQPFKDKDLVKYISFEIYNRMIEQRAERKVWDQWKSQLAGFQSQLFGQVAGLQSQLSGLKFDLDGIKEDVKVGFDENRAQLQRLAKGLDRSLAALALLSANQFMDCPKLVLMKPLVFDEKFLKDPMGWSKDKRLQKYSVVFMCAHSGVPGHEPFEIEVPRGWIVKVAPWLKVCLWVIKKVVDAYGVPLPIAEISILDQCEKMAGFLDSVIDEAAGAVLDNFQAFLENDTTPIEARGEMQDLTGDAYKLIAEKAQKEKRRHLWMPPKMAPVLDQNGTTIWVTGDCAKKHYGVRVNHEDDTTST